MATKTTPTPTDISTDTNDAFTQELQKKLLGQSDLISSSSTQLESKISSAIQGVKKAQTASTKRIESAYDREYQFKAQEASNDRQGALDSRSGFATNTALLRNMQQVSEKNLKDLDQRKQELILQGESEAAGQIAALQMKELEFKQKSQQDVFSNLLQLGNFSLQQKQESRLSKAQTFAEKSAISSIALQYGVAVQPGDTIDTVAARAAPYASEKQQLELQKIRADIRASNASAAKALQGDKVVDKTTIQSIARMAAGNPSFLAQLDGDTYEAVVAEMEVMSRPRPWSTLELRNNAMDERAIGTDFTAAKAAIASNPTIQNKQQAYKELEYVYKTSAATPQKNPLDSVTNWFTVNVLKERAQF